MKAKTRSFVVGGLAAGSIALGATAAMAASTVTVTPTDTQGWSTADTNSGGAVNFVVDSSAPAGVGALQLTTDATTAAKAQYLHAASAPLANVNELSYYTKQVAPAGPIADPSYQVIAYLNGGTSGFTTLVFEPYQNTAEGAILPGAWQKWDVASGLFWSTRTVTCSNGTIAGTPGGPAVYTLSAIEAACPNAVVAGFGVNVGSNNPSYNVETDLVDFNGTVYNFEPYRVAASKDDCKNGGWMTVRQADGSSFRNQGDCIQYVNTGK
ncbi:MAG TPA: hypothetical protein VFH70_03730 [Acidimicrobiales bacterium]|nr:hypothetical protein [Acidimicrobiales bacterium]